MRADPDGDDNYEEMPIKIPINPLNVFPVAVVYDDDDRTTGTEDRNREGGEDNRGTPRALNICGMSAKNIIDISSAFLLHPNIII